MLLLQTVCVCPAIVSDSAESAEWTVSALASDRLVLVCPADLLKERDHLNGAVSSSPPTHHAAPPYSPLGGGGGAEAADGAGAAGPPPPPPPRPERPASLTASVGKSGGRHPRWLLCYQSSSAPCPGSGGPHSPSPPLAPSQRPPPPPYPATPPAGRPVSLPAPLHRPAAHGESACVLCPHGPHGSGMARR